MTFAGRSYREHKIVIPLVLRGKPKGPKRVGFFLHARFACRLALRYEGLA